MDKFRYNALDDSGQHGVGRRGGRHRGAPPTSRLLDRGYQPLEVTEKKSILQFEITKKKVPAQGDHALLAPAGRLREGRHPDPGGPRGHRRGDDRQAVQEGAPRHDRAASRPATPSPPRRRRIPRRSRPTTSASSTSAELTGNLDVVLDQLADYIERDIEARGKITSALIYPAVVFVHVHRRRSSSSRRSSCRVRDLLRVASTPSCRCPTRMLLSDLGLHVELVVGLARRTAHSSSLGRSCFATARHGGRAWLDSLILKLPVSSATCVQARHPRADLPDPVVDDPRRRGAPRGHDGHRRRHEQRGLPRGALDQSERR